MNSNQIIGWMIMACICLGIFIIFSKPIKLIAKVGINSIIGISSLLIGNYFLAPMGMGVGINLFTAAFTGILGIPGVVSLYIMNIFSTI